MSLEYEGWTMDDQPGEPPYTAAMEQADTDANRIEELERERDDLQSVNADLRGRIAAMGRAVEIERENGRDADARLARTHEQFSEISAICNQLRSERDAAEALASQRLADAKRRADQLTASCVALADQRDIAIGDAAERQEMVAGRGARN